MIRYGEKEVDPPMVSSPQSADLHLHHALVTVVMGSYGPFLTPSWIELLPRTGILPLDLTQVSLHSISLTPPSAPKPVMIPSNPACRSAKVAMGW